MAASGLIFRLMGMLFLISSHRMSVAKPASTFSMVSARRHVMASGVHADG